MFKHVLDIYNRNLVRIFALMMLVIFPVTSLIFLPITYFAEELSVFFLVYSIIANFIICLPPFLLLTLKDLEDDKASIKEVLTFFVVQFGPLVFITFLLYTIAYYTSWMLLIPTFIIMLVLLILPFYSDLPSLKEMFIKTKEKIIEENIAIIVDLIIITSLLLLIWSFMMYFIQSYDNNIISFMLIRATLNMIIFPFIYIYLTVRYRKNKEELRMIQV